MSIVKEKQVELIKQVVLSSDYYEGNEDLLYEFCQEVYGKSYLLFKTVSNHEYLKGYLRKIATTSIIKILKQKNRLKRNPSSYMTVKEPAVDSNSAANDVKALPARNKHVYDVYKIEDPYEEDFEPSFADSDIKKVLYLVQVIDSANPSQNYLALFKSRYIDNKSNSEIAQKLNLPENIVLQRLLELSVLICKNSQV